MIPLIYTRTVGPFSNREAPVSLVRAPWDGQTATPDPRPETVLGQEVTTGQLEGVDVAVVRSGVRVPSPARTGRWWSPSGTRNPAVA